MLPMTSLIRRRPIAMWYALTMVLSAWFFVVLPWLTDMRPDDVPGVGLAAIGNVPLPVGIWLIITRHPSLFTALCYAFAGTLAALVIIAIARGRDGLREYASRLRPWRDGVTAAQALPYYCVLLASFLGFAVMLVVVDHLTTRTGITVSDWRAIRPAGIDLLGAPWSGMVVGGSAAFLFNLVGGLLFNGGGVLEEMGWRGFALPNLQRHLTPLRASIIVGLFWFFWHELVPLSPMLFDWHTGTLGEALRTFGVYSGANIVSNIAGAIFFTYFFNRTGGSVIATMMMHGLYNTVPFGVPLANPALAYFAHVVFVAVAAGVVLRVSGPSLGLRANVQ